MNTAVKEPVQHEIVRFSAPETAAENVSHPTPSVVSAQSLTPMQLLDVAVSRGATPETLEKLLALQERWEKNQARKAFDAALSDARAQIKPIVKNRKVDFTSNRTNTRTNYSHEDMAGIATAVDPILSEHGLSYRYRTTNDANGVTVTCIISHRDGHSEENSLSGGRDETGNKNNLQALGSTVTYLQRYTLKAALGLAAAHDDDGAASGNGESISNAQLAELIALADKVGADKGKFCNYFEIDGMALLPNKKFNDAKQMLEAFQAQKRKKSNG